MLTISEIGQRIKRIRKLTKVSQETLAEKAELDKRQLQRIENGETPNPGLETMHKIAKALNISMDYLLDEDYFLEDLLDFFTDCPGLIAETRSIAKSFYPSNADEIGSNIMLKFFIYLPLMDIGELFDVLLRVDGDVFSREQYLVQQINYLIRIISDDNPAKLYADYRADQCSYDHLRQYYSYGPDCNIDDDLFKSYIAYRNLIEKKREMTKVFFNLFEKIYEKKGV